MILIAVSILMASCATSYSGIAPEWYRHPPTRVGALQFMAEGTGETPEDAEMNALLNIMAQMGRGLGYSIEDLYMRELSTTGRIDDLGAYIEESYSAEDDEGWHSFILAVAPSGTYYANRSEEYMAMLERENDIRSSIRSAEESYRLNHDTQALTQMLGALDKSLDGPVSDESLQPMTLLSRAIEYLDAIEIDAVSGESVDISMWRRRGLFHPVISEGEVEIVYRRLDSNGNETVSSVVAKTGENGHISYVPTDPYALRHGTIEIRPYIPESLISSLQEADDVLMWPFMEKLDECTVSAELRNAQAGDESCVIAFGSYQANGDAINDSSAFEAFSSYLESAGAGAYPIVVAPGEETEEIHDNLTASYPAETRFIIVRTGLVDSVSIHQGFAVRADAQIFIDGIEETASAVAEGSSVEDAGANALKKASRIAAGLLLSRL